MQFKVNISYQTSKHVIANNLRF